MTTPAETSTLRPRASTPLVLLAVLAVAIVLWIAQDLILPILLAMFFALVGNPIIRLLRRCYLPRFAAALLVLLAGLVCAVLLGRELMAPAAEWITGAPRELHEISTTLHEMTQPVQQAGEAAENMVRAAGGDDSEQPVEVVRTVEPYEQMLTTPRLIITALTVLLLTFFFMVYGGRMQRNAIALLPTLHQKKITVDILQSIELEVSRYVLTISCINAVVGLVYAALLFFVMDLPLDESLLWGTMAALLNFAPYVGPLIGMLTMLLVGFVAFDSVWQSLLPAGMYLGLHTLEGQVITPIVVGARMAISPLVLILGLMVFGWMWGIIGLLLAVPLLVCVKIVLTRVEGLGGWARLIE